MSLALADGCETMSNYIQLVNLRIEHEFFAGNQCRALSCVPDPTTSTFATNNNLMLKMHADGLSILADVAHDDAMMRLLDTSQGIPTLWFRLYVDDQQFTNYSIPTTFKKNAVLVFASSSGSADNEKRQAITVDSVVSEADFHQLPSVDPALAKLEEREFSSILTTLDRRIPPLAFLRISLTSDQPKKYLVRFQSRKTYWKYYLLGALVDSGSHIFDTQKKLDFGTGVETKLADERRALMFRSSEKIPLRQHSDEHFQLRTTESGRNKVLIKHLPVASRNRLNTDTINGKPEMVSEIYINF